MGILIEETKYNRSYSICLLLFVAVVVICLFDFFSGNIRPIRLIHWFYTYRRLKMRTCPSSILSIGIAGF